MASEPSSIGPAGVTAAFVILLMNHRFKTEYGLYPKETITVGVEPGYYTTRIPIPSGNSSSSNNNNSKNTSDLPVFMSLYDTVAASDTDGYY